MSSTPADMSRIIWGGLVAVVLVIVAVMTAADCGSRDLAAKKCAAAITKLDAWRAEGKVQFCTPTPLPKCETIERDLLERVVKQCRRKP